MESRLNRRLSLSGWRAIGILNGDGIADSCLLHGWLMHRHRSEIYPGAPGMNAAGVPRWEHCVATPSKPARVGANRFGNLPFSFGDPPRNRFRCATRRQEVLHGISHLSMLCKRMRRSGVRNSSTDCGRFGVSPRKTPNPPETEGTRRAPAQGTESLTCRAAGREAPEPCRGHVPGEALGRGRARGFLAEDIAERGRGGLGVSRWRAGMAGDRLACVSVHGVDWQADCLQSPASGDHLASAGSGSAGSRRAHGCVWR